MRTFGIIVMVILTCFPFKISCLSEDNRINSVNEMVAKIEKKIKEKAYTAITIDYVVFEGSGPLIKFYSHFDDKKEIFSLTCVKFEIPFEVYYNEYSYFFDKEGKILKFIKNTVNRPDNPPKQAIIFDKEGKIIWSNYKDEIPIKIEDLQSIFKVFCKKMYDLSLKHSKFM